MQKSKRTIFMISAAFILLESILTSLVQITSGPLGTAVSFASVASACLFTLVFFEKKQDSVLLSLALIFTVCADFFLVVLGGNKLLAMIFFSATQICYFLRLYSRQTKKKLTHVLARLGFVSLTLTLTVIVLGDGADALSLVSMFYFANLLMNIAVAFMQRRRSAAFAIGLLLFSMCDALIGLSVMDNSYLPLPKRSLLKWLANPPFNLAWLFYVPSQTLIALSGVDDRLKEGAQEFRDALNARREKEKAEEKREGV